MHKNHIVLSAIFSIILSLLPILRAENNPNKAMATMSEAVTKQQKDTQVLPSQKIVSDTIIMPAAPIESAQLKPKESFAKLYFKALKTILFFPATLVGAFFVAVFKHKSDGCTSKKIICTGCGNGVG